MCKVFESSSLFKVLGVFLVYGGFFWGGGVEVVIKIQLKC